MYHLIINENYLSKRKNVKKFNKVLEVFDKSGKEYTVHKTNRKGLAREITEEVTSGKGNSVIVVGGDGTLHDVLNGFKDFENNYMGLIPLGTGNDFAKAAGIPLNTTKAAKIIVSDNPVPIDFIEMQSGLRSLNAVGMGIDVDVLKRAYVGKNNKKSKYVRALIVSLAHFESYNFTAKYNGIEKEHFGLIGAVGNGVQFGGGIKFFPKARITDGYLDLTIVDYISKIATVGAFIKLMSGKLNRIKQVTSVRTKEVEFIPHNNNYSIEADGELYENQPFKVRIADDKLKFYVKNNGPIST